MKLPLLEPEWLAGLAGRQLEFRPRRNWFIVVFAAALLLLFLNMQVLNHVALTRVFAALPQWLRMAALMTGIPSAIGLLMLFGRLSWRGGGGEYCRCGWGLTVPDAGWGWLTAKVYLLFLPVSMAVAIVVQGVMKLCGLQPMIQPLAKVLLTCPWSVVGVIAFFAMVMAPLTEELLFRQVVFRALAGYFGVWPGLAGTAALFMIFHWGSWAQFPALLLLGTVLQLLYLRTRSLWPCVLLHAVNNGVTVVLLLAVRCSGMKELPDWL